jgi:hypothetical protein
VERERHLTRIFESVAAPDDPPEEGALDSSHVKARRCAHGGIFRRSASRNRPKQQDHAIVDEFCRPWAFILTPGNTADCTMAEECVSLIPGVKELIAEKGYDTNAIRAFLKENGIKAVIPSKSNRK